MRGKEQRRDGAYDCCRQAKAMVPGAQHPVLPRMESESGSISRGANALRVPRTTW